MYQAFDSKKAHARGMVNGGRFPPPKITQKTPKEQKQNKAIGFQKTPAFCKSEKQIVGMYIKKILDFAFVR